MKRIVYTTNDGKVSVFTPGENARLATRVDFEDGRFVASNEPLSVWKLCRPWPQEGATAQWAETEDEFVTRLSKLEKIVPADATNVRFVEEGDIPTDRSFRDAWANSGGRITVDMGKAREIHKQRLRIARKPILEALDVEYMRADEDGDTNKKKAIAARKKALRDVTSSPEVLNASTPQELSAAVPDELKGTMP